MGFPVYLDHLATTPCGPRVVDAMLPFLRERFGHPASGQHAYGWDAERALETARARVADLLGAEPPEIVFTSGGTEADNLALKGVAEALEGKGRHLVTTAIEARGVRDSARWLASRGMDVTWVPVDATGRVDADAVAAALRDDTVLVSVQLANGEVGTLQPIAAIAEACAARGTWLHVDAAHAAGWVPLDVQAMGIHLLSIAGHRMHGPKGIGALYVRRRRPRVRLEPQVHGGGHERGRRSGTVDVPGAVGLGVAAELVRTEGATDAARVASLRDRLEAALADRVEGVRWLGDRARRLPGASALAFDRVEGESLVLGAPRVAFATGSACTSATLEPSYVLEAMGLDAATRASAVRFGLGRFTTEAEVDEAATVVAEAVLRVRASGA